MTVFQALFLGAIQGITEFLPVSSSAHLLVAPKLFGLPYQGKEFDIFLNLGSLLAIMVFFYSEVISMIVGMKDTVIGRLSRDRHFFVTMFLSSLPTIFVFGIAEIVFHVDISSPIVMSVSMIVFAIVLYWCDTNTDFKRHVTRGDSILTGVAQTLSLIPGVSRLGSCLSMMRYRGYSREESFRYSMILSIPPAGGACVLKLIKVLVSNNCPVEWSMVWIGCLSSFVFGLISLRLVVCFMRKCTLLPIVVYRILFGIFLWIYLV